VLIEGTAFALAIGAYFFLATRLPHWPPHGVAPPDLGWGTINTIVLLASGIPNDLARRAGQRIDLRGVRIWMVVCLVFGVVFNAIRAIEFAHLNVGWDHEIAKRIRHLAQLDPEKGEFADDIVYTAADGPSPFAHPLCANTWRNGNKLGDEANTGGY
jgi:hypothetical protein